VIHSDSSSKSSRVILELVGIFKVAVNEGLRLSGRVERLFIAKVPNASLGTGFFLALGLSNYDFTRSADYKFDVIGG
jgi:5-formaminoimidazole-4-carboxamide-1-beta-D-ribofuranosyl 5'-monophosphate synthetase